MNKRIKKKIAKRGYKSWKRYKSFDAFYTVYDKNGRDRKIGIYFNSMQTFGTVNRNGRSYTQEAVLHGIKTAIESTSAECAYEFTKESTYDRFRHLDPVVVDIDLSTIDRSAMPEQLDGTVVTSGQFDFEKED